MVRQSIGLFIGIAWLGVVCDATTGDASKPNVIVIFTDDHGWADMSCQGIFDDIKTPHIDALADGGVRMTSGYVSAPQCVPSRAGLLSGRYQNRFGVESNGMPLDGFDAQQTIAERLKDAGYATGMIGKWHLGRADEIVNHGFDDVFYQGGAWTNYSITGSNVKPGTRFGEMYHLDAKSAAAKAFIKRHHKEPFFLYLAYRAPHVPLDATPKYLNRFPGKMPERRRQALAMISAVDDGVGGVLESLHEFGLEKQTLIFFIGDNGAPLKIHKIDAPGGGPGWDGSLNDPMNGEKGMLAEGGIRVPFVVYWKGRIAPGQVSDHPVISLDVAATAVALAGLPHDSRLDGVNLIPHLTGEVQTPPHETLFWRWIAQGAVREGRWKYLRGGEREYLFDLSTDKEEKKNLLQEHPEIADRLRTKFASWSRELQPPGLETRPMSETWRQYFDYYLDGKPAPPPAERRRRGRDDTQTRIQGWLVRNGTLEVKNGSLLARPRTRDVKARAARPFIVVSNLDLPPSIVGVVRLRTSKPGKLGFAWREKGQNDFPAAQVVTIDCPASSDWQQQMIKIPARGNVIHVRLLLPPAGADIQNIEFQDEDLKPIKTWRFGPANKR